MELADVEIDRPHVDGTFPVRLPIECQALDEERALAVALASGLAFSGAEEATRPYN